MNQRKILSRNVNKLKFIKYNILIIGCGLGTTKEAIKDFEKFIDATIKKHRAQSKPATKTTKSKKE